MNFYKHHLGDYDGATAHLSWDEDLAYRRLLGVYYRTELPIPAAQAHRLVRASTSRHREAVDVVLSEFFVRDGEVWRNKRADAEIAAYQHQVSVNRRVGKLGGRPNRSETESVTEPEPNRNPNQEPDTKNQEPEESKSTTLAQASRLSLNGTELIPLKDGGAWQIPSDFLAELQRLCPRVDAVLTLREIRVWCLANVEKQKTARGVRRFVGGWFAREQAKADGAQA